MKLLALEQKIAQLRADGKVNDTTEIAVPASPEESYDRTSIFEVRVLRKDSEGVAKEVILVDPSDSSWKRFPTA